MKLVLSLAAVLALSACATANPDVVPRYQSQRLSQVYDATVLSVRPVTIDGSQTGIGSTAGAVAGGVAGSTIGGHRDSIVGAVVGAVVGGVVGNAVERNVTKENAVEIVVQMSNGQRRAVVQGNGSETYAPGDPVVLVVSGGRTRVSHAPAVGQPVAYPAPAGVPTPAGYPNAPVQPVYPSSGPVPPR